VNVRTITRLVAVPVAAVALSVAALGSAQAATPAPHASGVSVKSYSAGAFSTQFVITNHTGQTLTFDSAHTNVNYRDSSTHWGQRPLGTLSDGQSETVTAYTHDLGGLDMEVTYDLPNGEFAYFGAFNDLVGSNDTQEGVYGAFKNNAFNAPDTSTQDNAYTGTGSAPHGVHITATAEIHRTDS
jgi:hypothetical protein